MYVQASLHYWEHAYLIMVNELFKEVLGLDGKNFTENSYICSLKEFF